VTTAVDLLEGADIRVLEGLEGHLFVRSASGLDIASSYTDERAVPDRILDAWAVTLTARRREFARLGIVYRTVIVPDAHVIYPDRLPEGVTLAERSPAQRLIERLDRETAAQTVYLRDALMEGRARWETYQRVDRHWSDRGAWIGYGEVMRSLRGDLANLSLLNDDDIEWSERRSFGVLGSLVTPERSEQLEHARLKQPQTKVIVDILTERREALQVHQRDDPDLPTLVVFRDSFMTALAALLAQSFRRTAFVTSENTIYYDLVAQEAPDVVVHEICEHRLGWTHPQEPSPADYRWTFADLHLRDEAAVSAQRESRSLAAAGRLEEALPLNERAIKIEGPTSRLLLRRAEILLALGRADAAIEAARHATSLDPRDGGPWSLIARACEGQGRLPDAADAHYRAVAAEPGQPAYWGEAISAALRLGDVDLALQLGNEALERHPNHPTTAHADSYVQLAAGRLEAAAAASRRAVALDPVVGEYSKQLAAVLLHARDWEAARDAIGEVIRAHPDDVGAIGLLAEIERQVSQLDADAR
jgi:alginate O-acetyltransferase complex protein AlgJ